MKPTRPSLPIAPAEAALSLRWACEDCAYFVPDRAECAHGYPSEMHRRDAAHPEFCKEFELA